MKHQLFVLGEAVDFEESMTCEFKEVKGQNPTQAIGKVVDEYVVAYLNEAGGSVYWGIRDNDRLVVGVTLDHDKRDQVRQVVGQKIAAIAPSVSSDCYQVPFHKVMHTAEGTVAPENTLVVEVSVRPPDSGALYLTGSGEAYKKTLGGKRKLTGAELLNALLVQLQAKQDSSQTPESVENSELTWMPSVARRARYVRPLLRGARVLWVDDNPSNNLYERTALASLDISVDLALSTEEALYMTSRLQYDLVLSDMNRAGNVNAGTELLDHLKPQKAATPLVFYVGQIDRQRTVPLGAFGITNRPDELFHYVFDVLERRARGTD